MTPTDFLDQLRNDAESFHQDGVYWVPIRHHSPACSFALTRLLEEINPSAILIEGPADCQGLLASVQDERTRPPVAFLTQRQSESSARTAYFPMCSYSPEFVAIRYAGQNSIPISLIDLPYDKRPREEMDSKLDNLMSERHLAHSHYLNSIAKQMGCQDTHQAWDRLFEQRSLDDLGHWREFFNDVLAYCALARYDYEDDVLKASGDLDREHYMLSSIVDALKKNGKGIVVVTGGFHTPALMNALKKHDGGPLVDLIGDGEDRWLVRYSFDQLDALNGYSAGMPSPSYYQHLWDGLVKGEPNYLSEVSTRALVDIAHDNRQQKLTQVISSAEVKAAVFQCEQLARLRDVHGPGRSEVLESVASCYVKDAIGRSISTLADARRVLCGDDLGDIPDDVEQTPLVKSAWQTGRSLGLNFESTFPTDITLEPYKKDKHRLISRFFHLMRWIGCSLAGWQSGPDFINGYQTSLVREQWRYAWAPSVESELISLLNEGGTLESVAIARLLNTEGEAKEQGVGRFASTTSQLIIQACLMGLHKHVKSMASNLTHQIDEDDHIDSIVDCGYKLQSLSEGKAFLEVDLLGIDLEPLIEKCWIQALYQLPHLADLNDDKAEELLPAMKKQRAFAKYLQYDLQHYWAILASFLDEPHVPPVIKGASLAILLLDGQVDEKAYEAYLEIYLANGQASEVTVNALKGLIYISKESLWRTEDLLAKIHSHLCAWSEEQFLALLPSLRLLFTELAPNEIDRVARSVASIMGLNDHHQLSAESVQPDESEIRAMQLINEKVKQDIADLQLKEWVIHE